MVGEDKTLEPSVTSQFFLGFGATRSLTGNPQTIELATILVTRAIGNDKRAWRPVPSCDPVILHMIVASVWNDQRFWHSC